MKICQLVAGLCAVGLLAGCNSHAEVRKADGPNDVLVVRNASSVTSMRVAEYYMNRRNIDRNYLVSIETADSSLSAANEAISPKDYVEKIHKPISDYLNTHGLTDQIRYVVLTKGVPLRLSSDPTGGKSGGQSVDSVLATMGIDRPDIVKLGSGDASHGNPIVNHYWRAKEPFSHAKYGGYLVTRLDGYTESDAKALVDRAFAPAPRERIVLLDVAPGKGLGDPSLQPKGFLQMPPGGGELPQVQYCDFNADMIHLSQILAKRTDLTVVLDDKESFASSDKPLAVYVSWGSNDGKYSADTYRGLKFTSRSIAETAVSTSGRTMLKASGGQSLVADLVAQGAAGVKGYVTEPYLFSMASPSVFGDFYLSGRNLAESFYAASRFIGWKDVVLGDPLCRISDN